MARLEDQHKQFLLMQFAQDRSVSEVVKMFQEAFAIRLEVGQVAYYNPKYNTDLGEKWHAFFQEQRGKFFKEIYEVPIAHQAVRFARLWDMSEAARAKGNYQLAADLLRQAGEELGMYRNGLQAVANSLSAAAPAVNVNVKNNTTSAPLAPGEDPRARVAALLGIPIENLPLPKSMRVAETAQEETASQTKAGKESQKE